MHQNVANSVIEISDKKKLYCCHLSDHIKCKHFMNLLSNIKIKCNHIVSNIKIKYDHIVRGSIAGGLYQGS